MANVLEIGTDGHPRILLTLQAFTTDASKKAVRAMAAREQPTFTGQ